MSKLNFWVVISCVLFLSACNLLPSSKGSSSSVTKEPPHPQTPTTTFRTDGGVSGDSGPFINIFSTGGKKASGRNFTRQFSAGSGRRDGGTLHAILVADTNDDSIGKSVKIDLGNMEKLVSEISQHTGILLTGGSISGNDVNKSQILSVVEGLSVGPEDIVIYYYSGHGHNPGGTAWPAMVLEGGSLPLKTVREKLKAKGPRLLIVMADTCNGFSNRRTFNASRAGGKKANYEYLFLKHKGVITASSSEPGEYSWGNEQIGGLFTDALLNSLNQELVASNPSWKAIMKGATKPLQGGSSKPQHPQVKLDVTPIGALPTVDCNRTPTHPDCVPIPGAVRPSLSGTCQGPSYSKRGQKCCKTGQGREHCWSLNLD
ncbi:MAG: hypothetical protein DRR08_04055 [Candidatus Parabeggiatoa sp. nov. 2]|nr:MAG: hypothetical protein DRR08_04055 [Gammaproteobacteria bacterium]